MNKELDIVVASNNPVKINATEIGLTKMFSERIIKVRGISVLSGVPDQPIGNEETLRGATNRMENASKLSPEADYWIGIEGGLEEVNGGEMEAFAWVVIKSRDGKTGRGKTGTFVLPKKIVEFIRQGKELGEADDIVFGRSNSKQSNGAVGILTGDVLNRTTFYEVAMVLASIPFRNPELY